MLLMSPSDAAQAIGGKCGGSTPDQEDPALISILKMITARVESACDVYSLTRGVYTDRFNVPWLPSGAWGEKVVFRPSNGFLLVDNDENLLTITDPDEEVLSVEADEYLVINTDTYTGVLDINRWTRGAYAVQYTSGFDVPELPDPAPPGYDPDARVLIDVPDWMKAIAVMYLTQWYRAVFVNPRGTKDISYSAVSDALNRMIHSAVYNKYQRPRMNCIWADRSMSL